MISDILDLMRGDMTLVEFIVSIGAVVFVVFCATPLHEFAHALVAYKLGDNTARNMGRLTISPLAHIDYMGAIMIFLFGFGYAKPVPVRMRNFKKPKRDMALVALAGPVSNVLQATVLLFIYFLIAWLTRNSASETVMYINEFFFLAAFINVNLAVFNLIPVPPLDGSRILNAVLPSKYYYKLMQYEKYSFIALLVLLATGILSVPISIASGLLLKGLTFITSLPFNL